jgi:hypothetical protein
MSVYIGYGSRQKLTLSRRLYERDVLRNTATAGAKQALAVLMDEDDTQAFDALSDSWANNPEVFLDVNVGAGSYDVMGHARDTGARLSGLVDETSKLNINTATESDLVNLFMLCCNMGEDSASDLAECILDWRDQDMAARPGGAEDFYYKGLRPAYECKDAELEVLEELLYVKGMNAAIFSMIRPYITVFGEGSVNINTVSRPVLLAMGLSADLTDKVFKFRKGQDKTEGTTDDGVFDSADSIVPVLSRFEGMSASEVAEFSNFVNENNMTVKTDVFSAESRARLNVGARNEMTVYCVMQRNSETPHGTGVKIKRWTVY